MVSQKPPLPLFYILLNPDWINPALASGISFPAGSGLL
jgi:hypothetical protein